MILIGLGSNVGDRAAQLSAARDALSERGVTLLAASALVETAALLPDNAPPAWDRPFLNQVIAVETELPPHDLLTLLKATEQVLGRQDRGRWGPREIDLDLLAYHEVTCTDALLELPHPGIATRRFVLAPLAEIAPSWRHPRTQQRAADMLAELIP